MWIEIFKTGTFTDKQGRTDTYNLESLNKIAAKYKEKIDNSPNLKTPIFKDHNKNNIKLGYVNELQVVNDKLMANIEITDEQSLKEINDKKLQNVSIGLNGDELDHLAFLENELPAVKNIPPLQLQLNINKNSENKNPENKETKEIEKKETNNSAEYITNQQKELEKYTQISPNGRDLVNKILNNLTTLEQDKIKEVGNDLISFIDDINKNYLVKEYSQAIPKQIFDYSTNTNSFNNSNLFRASLHLHILHQMNETPELNYEQALIKTIK